MVNVWKGRGAGPCKIVTATKLTEMISLPFLICLRVTSQNDCSSRLHFPILFIPVSNLPMAQKQNSIGFRVKDGSIAVSASGNFIGESSTVYNSAILDIANRGLKTALLARILGIADKSSAIRSHCAVI